MLDFAIEHREALIKADRRSWLDPDKKWYNLGGWNSDITIDNDDWQKIQMVSVDKDGRIHGYFSVMIDQLVNIAYSMSAINYSKKCDVTFSRDFYGFLYYLFVKRGYSKLEWQVVVGNPIEKMYDRFCKKAGGNIIGVRHKCAILLDRTIVDSKLYEIFREDVMKYIEDNNIAIELRNDG